jgi:phosphoribosylanthranilate isomerase
MVKIKFCGITDQQDALRAVELGVHSLGFIFAPSPRRVQPEDVRHIIDTLPPFVQTVGVFVDEDLRTIRDIVDFCRLDMVQLHGDEPPDLCSNCMPKTIKAFHLNDERSLQWIEPYCGKVRAFLFDTHSEGKRGGTGKTFDWDLAIGSKKLGVPVILAGGLSPSNIRQAILTVQPYAVGSLPWAHGFFVSNNEGPWASELRGLFLFEKPKPKRNRRMER